MREILFKAKRKDQYKIPDEKSWTYGNLVQSLSGKVSISKDDKFNPIFIDGIIVEVDPDTVSEYTGKRDSNGRKIFENDIVRVHSHCLNESYIAVVKFGEYGDGFLNKKGHIGFYLEFSGDENDIFRQDFGYYLEACKVEVIGNIFDNPELMEGNNE